MKYDQIIRTLGFWTLIVAVLFSLSVSYAYELGSAQVRYKKYEDGSTRNELYFEVLDDHGNYIDDGAIVTDVQLWDPNEILVDLDTVTFTPLYEYLGGRFELDTNQFMYNTSSVQISGFDATIKDPLIIGTYDLVVTTVDGALPALEINFYQKTDLPFVSYRSFQIHPDPSGNIYWMWDISQDLLDMANSNGVYVRGRVYAYNNDKLEFILIVRLPTYMGFLFIPQSVVQRIPGDADEYLYQIVVNASTLFSRAYSESIIVNDPLTTVPKKDCSKGDLDFDEDVDGEDLRIFTNHFGMEALTQ